MSPAYAKTTVAVERSQGEIRGLLAAHAAERFAFGEETDAAGVRWAAVSFQHGGLAVRMRVPYKPIDERLLRVRAQRARTRTQHDLTVEAIEQEAKRIWRVISWNLKARLIAVEEGVESFEEAFLAHIVNPRTNRTIYEELAEGGEIQLDRPLLPELEAGG